MQVCSIGFLAGLIYVSDIGIYMVDLVDHIAVNLTLMLVGTLQAYTVAWVWGWQEISARTGVTCAPMRAPLPRHMPWRLRLQSGPCYPMHRPRLRSLAEHAQLHSCSTATRPCQASVSCP